MIDIPTRHIDDPVYDVASGYPESKENKLQSSSIHAFCTMVTIGGFMADGAIGIGLVIVYATGWWLYYAERKRKEQMMRDQEKERNRLFFKYGDISVVAARKLEIRDRKMVKEIESALEKWRVTAYAPEIPDEVRNGDNYAKMIKLQKYVSWVDFEDDPTNVPDYHRAIHETFGSLIDEIHEYFEDAMRASNR